MPGTYFWRPGEVHDIHSTTELTQPQDTTARTPVQDSLVSSKDSVTQDTNVVTSGRTYNISEADSIFRAMEEREMRIMQMRDSLAKKPVQVYRPPVYLDTTEVMYELLGVTELPIYERTRKDALTQDFLLNFKAYAPKEKTRQEKVFLEDHQSSRPETKETVLATETHRRTLREEDLPARGTFDWVTVLLILSLLLIGWVRLFNGKYLSAIFRSAFDYQLGSTIYKEKNSLTQRAAFLMNVMFYMNWGLFIFLLLRINPIDVNITSSHLLDFLIFAATGLALYLWRGLTSSFTGWIFLKQKVFDEYFHHVNLYMKNIGLFLFPVVVMLQFIPSDNFLWIEITGLIIILFFYLIQIIRSFQIIVKKNVSKLYMILYLCAFEFAPFLILYKFLIIN